MRMVLIVLLSASFFLCAAEAAEKRLFVVREGVEATQLIVVCPPPEKQPSSEDDFPTSESVMVFAKEHGFNRGFCMYPSKENFSAMTVVLSMGMPSIYYLTPDELDTYKKEAQASRRLVDLKVSETWPPEN